MEAKLTAIAYLLFVLISLSEFARTTPLVSHHKFHLQRLIPSYSKDANSNNSFVSTVTVATSSGLLEGTKQMLNNLGNSSIYKFLSVPYAEPPVGQLRFQRPMELKETAAAHTVDASNFGKTCPQYRHLTRFISPLLNIDRDHQISEDCLHLHIYVPQSVGSIVEANNRLEPNQQLPVIVWIPGEGFDFADARQFDGSYLAHKTQSIVITVQYRVGVLGFLHAPEHNIMGNMGIHDQLMALKWIRRNINRFGGDADRVTLMGRFSGSMSISAMVTAPNQQLLKLDDQMLFSRVAMLSGVAVKDWIIDSKQSERTKELEEEAVNRSYCNTSDINCLKNLTVEQLLKISSYGWRLVVDNELIGNLSPIEAVQQNQFASELESVLIGETGMEGTLCLYRHMLDNRNQNNYAQLIEEDRLTTSDLYDIIRDDSRTYFKYNLTKSNPIQNALESLVEDTTADQLQEVESSKLREKYLQACSAYMIKSHSNRFKRKIVAMNHLVDNRMDSTKRPVEVFHYELKYKPTFSLAPNYIKTAAHGDDVPLIFGLIYSQSRRDINEADLLMTRKMMAYVGNFVHGNNPLLHQQPSIETRQESRTTSENETTSMDENEPAIHDDTNSYPTLIRRSWSSEGQLHLIEFNENDLHEINQSPKRNQLNKSASLINLNPYTTNNAEQQFKDTQTANSPTVGRGSVKPNMRLILIESPISEIKPQPLIEFVEQKNQANQQQEADERFALVSQYIEGSKTTQRLYQQRQPLYDDKIWFRSSANSQMAPLQASQQPSTSFINESSFITVLVFSSCIVIFTLMSLCLGLSLIILRNNLSATKQIQQFKNSSSSSCNICDESRGSSIDAVLGGTHRKENRGFSNVFAKLSRHQNTKATVNNQTSSTQCCTTSTSTHKPHVGAISPIDLERNQVLIESNAIETQTHQ